MLDLDRVDGPGQGAGMTEARIVSRLRVRDRCEPAATTGREGSYGTCTARSAGGCGLLCSADLDSNVSREGGHQ